MVRTRLKRLFLSGFRSFVDDTTIEFSDTGLWLLQGVSGSGKSSVFVAIAYALGYAPYPATELLSWGGVATLKVELTLDTPQGEVRVRRSPPGFHLWVAGEPVKGGAKACEERLQSVLGASPEILALLTYRQQQTPGLFLSQSDSEKKELLCTLLGLDKYEKAIDTSQAAIKALEGTLQVAQTKLDAITERLGNSAENPSPEALREQISVIEKYILTTCSRLEYFKAKIEACKEQRRQEVRNAFDSFAPAIAQAKDTISGILKPVVTFDDSEANRLSALVNSASARITALTAEDLTKQNEDKAKRQAIQKQILACREKTSQRPGLSKDKERLSRELELINGDNCPTCERPWEHTEAHKKSLLLKLNDIGTALAFCDESEAKEKELQLSLAFLPDFAPNPLIAKLREAKTKAEEQLKGEQARKRSLETAAEAEYRQNRAEAQAVLSQLQAEQMVARNDAAKLAFPEMEEAELALETERTEEGYQRTQLAVLKQTLSHAVQAEAAKKALLATEKDLQTEVERLTVELAAEKDFLGAVDRTGFLGSIFDEVLEEISQEVNDSLASIANTQRVTLSFRSESVTAKGTTKRNISPVVSVGGIESASIKSALSGGMLSTVTLAVDLALGEVISRRSGATPGWLVLDESFEGLGTADKESMMAILERFSRDRLVLVCDHASEFKASFSKTLQVSCIEGRSSIV